MGWSKVLLNYYQYYYPETKPEKSSEKISNSKLDDNWEIIGDSDSTETYDDEKIGVEFQKTVHTIVPVGIYSLITPKTITAFLRIHSSKLACYWPDEKSESAGSLRIASARNSVKLPPGWFIIDKLEHKITSLYTQLEAIYNEELMRLRKLELYNPYANNIEYKSIRLKYLFLYKPFLQYICATICCNPFMDLNVVLPFEMVSCEEELEPSWENSVDFIHDLLRMRPKNQPPLFFNLVAPRQTSIENDEQKQLCRQKAAVCCRRYSAWLDMCHFQL